MARASSLSGPAAKGARHWCVICIRDAEYGDVLRLSFDNVLLELPTGAESALDMVLASSSFRVGELAGLTDESKVVLVRRLLREGVLCQNSAQPHAALP